MVNEITCRIVEYNSKEQKESFDLRVTDLANPLGKTREDLIESFGDESDQLHVCALKGNTVVGCCLLVLEPTKIKVRQFVVKKGQRGQQIGAKILQFVNKYAIENGIQTIYGDVVHTALNFFLANNWKICKDPVTIIGHTHYPMRCDLKIPAKY